MADYRVLSDLGEQYGLIWAASEPESCLLNCGDLEFPQIASLCDEGNQIIENAYVEICFPINEEIDDYTNVDWQVYNYPFVHFLEHPAETIQDYQAHPGDYADFIYGLDVSGYLGENHVDSQALRTITQHLQSLVNMVRLRVNLPIIPLGYVPPLWESGLRLPGGHVIRHNHHCYYTRYPLSAEQNTISPVQDVNRTRFRDFNGGPAHLPVAADDIVINREYTTSQSRINSERVYINFDDNVMYLIPGNGVTLEQLKSIKRYSTFYYERTSAGETARMIARANNKGEWELPWDNSQTAIWIDFDPEWLQSELGNTDQLRLGFEVVEEED